MTGVRTAANRVQAPKWSVSIMSSPDFCSISLMSAPAANAFSLPVTTIAPTPSSASNASAAATTSRMVCVFKALRASGRSRVIHPTRPRCSTRIVSYSASWSVMSLPSCHRGRPRSWHARTRPRHPPRGFRRRPVDVVPGPRGCRARRAFRAAGRGTYAPTRGFRPESGRPRPRPRHAHRIAPHEPQPLRRCHAARTLRPTMRRMISFVPSRIWCTRRSRTTFSMP